MRALEDDALRFATSIDAVRECERADCLLDQLVEYERRLEWTRTDRRESKPGWFQKPAPLKAIQCSLRPDEVLVEYVLSEPHSYCVWISKKSAGVKALPAGRKQIEELTRRISWMRREQKRDDIGLANNSTTVLLARFREKQLANGSSSFQTGY